MKLARKLAPRLIISIIALTTMRPTAAVSSVLGPPELHAVGDFPMSVAVGRLDSGAFLDVAVANRSSGDVSIVWDAAGPGALETRIATGSAPRAVAIGDLNGDQLPDVAVGRELTDPTLVVHYNRGDRTFGQLPERAQRRRNDSA